MAKAAKNKEEKQAAPQKRNPVEQPERGNLVDVHIPGREGVSLGMVCEVHEDTVTIGVFDAYNGKMWISTNTNHKVNAAEGEHYWDFIK